MSAAAVASLEVLSDLPVPLQRDTFMRSLLRELAGTLQEVVGLDEAQGFVSLVGQHVGEELNESYRIGLGVGQLSREQVAAVLVDMQRRVGGDFYVIDQDDDKIVLGNRACPFAGKVAGRPALCMMTSNVFGVIAGENLGFAKVVIDRAIAHGHPECRVTIHLRGTPEAEAALGREYYQA
jgi:predicted ArsR family transcriptional regulator